MARTKAQITREGIKVARRIASYAAIVPRDVYDNEGTVEIGIFQEALNGWPWDSSCPVAGQYEAYCAKLAKARAANRAVAHARLEVGDHAIIADQGRHDVAAAAVRHADLPVRPDGWIRDLDAIEYEHTRAAEPDQRDEDDPLAEATAPAAPVAKVASSPPREPAVAQQARAMEPPADLLPLRSWPPNTGCEPKDVP